MSAKIILVCRNLNTHNTSRFALFLFFSAFLLGACKKTDYPDNPSTVQIFNALDDGEGMYANLSGGAPAQYSTLLNVGNKSYLLRNNLIYVNQYPQPVAFYTYKDTLPKDPPVLNALLDLAPGSVYSLFIYGTKVAPGYFLNTDQIPVINRKDSTTHLRVVNLCQGQELSVNIKGKPHKSFIDKLDFKGLSPFAELSASKAIATIELEFRDYTTGNLLATYTASNIYADNNTNLLYSRSNTLAFVGKKGGTGTNLQKVILMNHR